MLASTAKPSPPTRPSAIQRPTTVSNSCRRRSASRKRPWRVLEKVEWSGTSPSRPKRQNPRYAQVQVDLFAQPPFRADAEAIAHDQHADQQLRIDRRPSRRTVEGRQVCPNPLEVNKAVDRPQQMIPGHMPFERKLVEQRVLLDLPLPHHRLPPSRRDLRKSGDYTAFATAFFNTIHQKPSFGGAICWVCTERALLSEPVGVRSANRDGFGSSPGAAPQIIIWQKNPIYFTRDMSPGG
jgi:hypothetical protein